MARHQLRLRTNRGKAWQQRQRNQKNAKQLFDHFGAERPFTEREAALRLRRRYLSPGTGKPDAGQRADLRRADDGPSALAFTRGETFRFVANLGAAPVALPAGWELLLASSSLQDGNLPADTAAWLTRPPAV